MRTLLFAAILYLIGVVVVLLLRPSFMFDENGNWKEFGTLSNNHTIFPFWLFCIVWAALSYCITLLGGSYESGAIASVATTAMLSENESPEDLVYPLPPKRKSKAAPTKNLIETPNGTMKPGYYMLNAKETKKSGIPKYVFIGNDSSEPVPVGKEDSDSD